MFKRFLLSLLSFTIVLSCGFAVSCDNKKPAENNVSAPTEEPKQDYTNVAKVIIMAGQSNMSGATPVPPHESGDPNNYRQSFENIKIMYSTGDYGAKENLWNSSKSRLRKVRMGQGSNGNGFGPEFGLAQYLTEQYPEEEFYLVKHALGGAPIDHYLNSSSETHLNGFAATRKEFDAAVAEIKTLTQKEVKVVAICWMQGETESGTSQTASTYGDKLEQLVTRFREEYKDYAPCDGIAFIDAYISDSSMWPFHEAINEAKLEFSQTSSDNFYIDTIGAGLTLGPDNAHYDTKSQVMLGRLFGEKIKYVIDN